MKRLEFTFLFFLLISLNGYSQSAEPQIISSSGDHFNNGTIQISFTIGEPVVKTVSDGTNTLTQGFHQTNWSFVGLEDYTPSFNISVYPNPVQDELKIESKDFKGVIYQIYDAAGKIVLEGNLENEKTQINTENLAPATYSLVLRNSNESLLKIYKLVKSH